MAKTPGRKPNTGQYKGYLPQVAATPEMVEQTRAAAERGYRGSMGAFIRAAVAEKLERDKPPAPLKWD